MAIIPSYPQTQYNIKPLDLSSFQGVFQNIQRNKELKNQDQRIKYLNAKKQFDELNIASNKLTLNQEKAVSLIENIENEFANAITYEENGEK
jgi:hypothetical protein